MPSIRSPWSVIISYLATFCGGLLRRDQIAKDGISRPDPPTPSKKEHASSNDQRNAAGRASDEPSSHFPLAEQQVEHAIAHFIASINRQAVCDLVSRYNGGAKCKILDNDNSSHGSFNVCFFVRVAGAASAGSDAAIQILRMPIRPVVVSGWEKVLSEITTMQYIQRKTTIPIPRVLSYGKDDTVVDGFETPFILMDPAPGHQLDTKSFLRAAKQQREQLYRDVLDVLAQLRQLEFATGGSLFPNINNETSPTIGRSLSMPANEYERASGGEIEHKVFNRESEFIAYHQHILGEVYRLPTEDLCERSAKMEVFALKNVLEEISTCFDSAAQGTLFVLAHPDLRFGNIFIDDQFHIVCLIDWEFAGSIPLRFFTPPPWITGHDPDTVRAMRSLVHGPSRDEILSEFREVLQNTSTASSPLAELSSLWAIQHQSDGREIDPLGDVSPLVQILRHPSSLMDIYYGSIFRKRFGPQTSRDTEVNGFFQQPKNKVYADNVERQIRSSQQYKEHLIKSGTYVEDETSRRIQEYLSQTEYLVKAK